MAVKDKDNNQRFPVSFESEEKLDASIASKMAKLIVNDPRMFQNYQTGKPGDLGLVAAQSVIGVRDKMLEKNYPFSPRIWTAENGVLNSTVDSMEATAKSLGVPFDRGQVYDTALKTLARYDEAGMQSKGKKGQQQGAPPAQPQGAPPMGAAPPQGPMQAPPQQQPQQGPMMPPGGALGAFRR